MTVGALKDKKIKPAGAELRLDELWGDILSGRHGGGCICQSNPTKQSPSHFGFSPPKRDPVHAAVTLASCRCPPSPSWPTDGMFGQDPEGFLLSGVFCRGGRQPISRLAALVGSTCFLLPSMRADSADILDGQPESEGALVDQLTASRRRVALLSNNWSHIPTFPSRR